MPEITPTGLEIQIRVTGLPLKPIEEFENFQGNLKKMERSQLAKLKASIVRNGFNAPVFVWKEHNYILDGHQRILAVRSLIEKDGMTLPGGALPYVDIEASSERQAKEMILTYNSQYGEISAEALSDLLLAIELPAEDLKNFIELPQIDLTEVMWHMRDTAEYQLVKRDMEDSEKQYLMSQGSNSIWGVSKAYVRFGRYYFFISHDLAEEIGLMIKDNGPKWLIGLIMPDLPPNRRRTVGPLFVLPVQGVGATEAAKAEVKKAEDMTNEELEKSEPQYVKDSKKQFADRPIPTHREKGVAEGADDGSGREQEAEEVEEVENVDDDLNVSPD